MKQPIPKKMRLALIAVAVIIAIGAAFIAFMTPRPKRYEAIEGRPLLAQDGKEFVDQQVGLRFTPPADWAMQARSTESPTHLAERRIVKYKRVSPTLPVAWLRVWVKDVADGMTPAELLRNHKPPEPGWKPLGDIKDDLRVGGMPAARRTYGGPLDIDGRGDKDFLGEILAIKRNGRIYEFSAAYRVDDEKARNEIRQTTESIEFISE